MKWTPTRKASARRFAIISTKKFYPSNQERVNATLTDLKSMHLQTNNAYARRMIQADINYFQVMCRKFKRR